MIRDADGNPVSSFSTSMRTGDVAAYTLVLDCESGYEFFADAVTDLAVEAKRSADASWVDIETTPIDLTPWAGTQQPFDVRLTASGSGSVRRAFALRVEHA